MKIVVQHQHDVDQNGFVLKTRKVVNWKCVSFLVSYRYYFLSLEDYYLYDTVVRWMDHVLDLSWENKILSVIRQNSGGFCGIQKCLEDCFQKPQERISLLSEKEMKELKRRRESGQELMSKNRLWRVVSSRHVPEIMVCERSEQLFSTHIEATAHHIS